MRPSFESARRALAAAFVLAAAAATAAPADDAAASGRDPVVSTYSIVARDAESGAFGVAVQSHWFGVGPLVAWAESGVGAVATQSLVEVSYGPKGLALMRHGIGAQAALDVLLEADARRDVRQVAMIDASGRPAVWTGPSCIAEAGHATGEGYAVQANLMGRGTVWAAMARAYEESAGRPFAERLLLALEAAEAEGGDIRGKQSAALLVVRGERSARPWEDRLVDLRVDDHPQPLAELRRLYDLHLAYEESNRGDAALAEDRLEDALAHFGRTSELAPGLTELRFWQAVALLATGHEERALQGFAEVFEEDPRWRRVVPRLPASGLLPDDPGLIEKILAATP